MRLDELPLGETALITAVDWDSLSAPDALRVRDLGIAQGKMIEATHYGPFAYDPIACTIACTIGSKTSAIRRAHAALVEVKCLAR